MIRAAAATSISTPKPPRMTTPVLSCESATAYPVEGNLLGGVICDSEQRVLALEGLMHTLLLIAGALGFLSTVVTIRMDTISPGLSVPMLKVTVCPVMV